MASFKRISQDTFDDVVRENVEEFDMSPADALQEAINQFNKQGVDLSNLDLTGGVGRQEILDAMALLKALAESNGDLAARSEEIASVIAQLRALCQRNHILSDRNVMLMKEQGGVNALHLLLDPAHSVQSIIAASDFLTDLSARSDSIRDFFEPGGSARLCVLLKDRPVSAEEAPVFISLLSLARQVMRSENNKTALMRTGFGVLLSHLLTTTACPPLPPPATISVLEKACACIRGLSIHDDLRRDMSSAYDNGKFFLKTAGVVPALMSLANQHTLSADLASYALSAAKALVTTNEAVQVLSMHGAIPLVFAIVHCGEQSSSPPLGLVRSAIGLLRNLSADDTKKEAFLSLGGLSALLHTISQEPYQSDGVLMEHAMACFAQFSLRSPSLSEKLVQAGAVEVIVRTMQCFPQQEGVQRQACLTLRNIAGRCADLRGVLLDAGAEAVLRAAGRLPSVVDEAYGALRDLNCEVQFVKVDVDGTVRPAYEHFGSQGKLNFRAVYDEAPDVEQKVAENARAPFAHSQCDEDDCDHDH